MLMNEINHPPYGMAAIYTHRDRTSVCTRLVSRSLLVGSSHVSATVRSETKSVMCRLRHRCLVVRHETSQRVCAPAIWLVADVCHKIRTKLTS